MAPNLCSPRLLHWLGATIPTLNIQYLLIGALTRDLKPGGGWQPGGSGWYAAQVVAQLGYNVAIATPLMTSHPLDFPDPITFLRIPSPQTATFDNRYNDGKRTQYINAAPAPLAWAALPPSWRNAPIVHLAPLAHELIALPPRSIFPRALIGLTAQGWLRTWDSTGRIRPSPWQPDRGALSQVDVIVVSEEDVGGDEAAVEGWAQVGPIVALTRGARGVSIWHRGERSHVAAYPTTVLDPTGAGDIWAAAFFTQLHQQVPVVDAARRACYAASQAIGTLE